MKIIGLLVMLLSIFGGFVIAGGEMIAIWQPAEILMIGGGALGAFLIANPTQVVRSAGRHIVYAVGNSGFNRSYFEELLMLLFTLFEMARRKGGSKVLEEHIEDYENSSVFAKFPRILGTPHICNFLVENLRLALVESVEPHEFESIVGEEVHSKELEMMRPAHALQLIADALPGFGILAAVLGIVITMGAIDGPMDELGRLIAAALTGTFLGIFFAYGLVGPMATATDHSVHNELKAFECIKTALGSHKSGIPSLPAVDSGRKMLFGESRPSFAELEEMTEAK